MSTRTGLRLAGGVALAALTAGAAAAADGRLYPSGPPGGVAYLRFVNLAPHEVTITSPAAKIAIPADGAQRIGQFDPVPPKTALTGTAQFGESAKPIDVTLAPNEFATVAVLGDGADGIAVTVFRETPSDFNALKASLGLFNADKACAKAELVAGDAHQSVIPDVAPGGVARRLVNPVSTALGVACGDPAQATAASLGQLNAGDRYSIFVVAGKAGREVIAGRDEQAPLRP
jgi:hypothetical protein